MGISAHVEATQRTANAYDYEQNNIYNKSLAITRLPPEIFIIINPPNPPKNTHTNLYMTCKHLHQVHLLHCGNKRLPRLLITIPTNLAYDDYTGKEVSQCNLQLNMEDSDWDLKRDKLYIFVRILDSEMDAKCRKQCTLLLMSGAERLVKFQQQRSYFSGKRVEMGVVGVNAFGGKLEWHGVYKLVEPPPIPPRSNHDYVRCWNGEALVHLFDGSVCPVEKLQVGDVLVSSRGNPTTVRRIMKSVINRPHKVVDMGDFYLTRGHPVWIDNEWYRADEVNPAQEVFVRELWNFYTEPEQFVVVGRKKVICSCLGGYCGRVAERDVISDGLFGRGYGSREAEDYRWLLEARARFPLEMERPFGVYVELIPGREHIKTLLMEQSQH